QVGGDQSLYVLDARLANVGASSGGTTREAPGAACGCHIRIVSPDRLHQAFTARQMLATISSGAWLMKRPDTVLLARTSSVTSISRPNRASSSATTSESGVDSKAPNSPIHAVARYTFSTGARSGGADSSMRPICPPRMLRL